MSKSTGLPFPSRLWPTAQKLLLSPARRHVAAKICKNHFYPTPTSPSEIRKCIQKRLCYVQELQERRDQSPVLKDQLDQGQRSYTTFLRCLQMSAPLDSNPFLIPPFANTKEAQIPCPVEVVLWSNGLPPLWFVGFPNKITFLAPTSFLLTYLLACCGASQMSLGLVTREENRKSKSPLSYLKLFQNFFAVR